MTKKTTHRIKFDARFETAIISGTESRTLRKNNKTNQKISVGDLIEFSRINADASETIIATAPITEIHAGKLDTFGMIISRSGINPARAANIASLAKLFGFWDFSQMGAFYTELGYLKEDTPFDGLVICWDPSQMEILAPVAVPAKQKNQKAEKKEPTTATPLLTTTTEKEQEDSDTDLSEEEISGLLNDAKSRLDATTDPAERASIEEEIKSLELALSDEGADE